MKKRTNAEGQTIVQKWVLVIVAFSILICVFPPAGLVVGALAGWHAVRSAAKWRREIQEQRERERFVAWRGDPANQQHMRGNGDNGGLSIEEQNAYRRAAHNQQRR